MGICIDLSKSIEDFRCRVGTLCVLEHCTVGTTGTYACGEEVSPHFEATSLKQETICL